MSGPIATMVREMLTLGVAADVIVLAVEAAEQAGMRVEIPRNSADATAERRRVYDRDRKRQQVESRRNSTGNPRNSTTPLTLPSLSTSESEVKKERKVRARKVELSAEFQPNEKHFEAAVRLGIPRQAVFDKCEDMRIWAASSGAVKADWSATLHGFLRRDAEKLKSNKPTVHDAARNQTNRAMEYLRQLDEPGGTRDAGDAAGGSPLRLLSSR